MLVVLNLFSHLRVDQPNIYKSFSLSSSIVIADEYAINPRNPYKNRMHASGINQPSWYANHTEIDYRGSDVTVQMFMDALLGDAPKSLNNLNENSRLMIYLAGHGGDQFFKFQDEEELMAQDIANLMDRMFEEKKFGSALFIAETCQAFTLFDKLTTPNVMAFGTSLTGESAYAHHADKDLGIAIIERWTHAFLANYEESNPKTTLYEAMFSPSEKKMLGASVGIKDDTSKHKFKDTKLSHFFGAKGGTSEAQVTNEMMKPKNTVINDSTNSLLDVSSSISSSWFQPQDLSASVSKKSSPKKKSLTSSKLQQLGNGGRITRDNDIYYVFPTLLMVLILMKKLEQQWFSCYV